MAVKLEQAAVIEQSEVIYNVVKFLLTSPTL